MKKLKVSDQLKEYEWCKWKLNSYGNSTIITNHQKNLEIFIKNYEKNNPEHKYEIARYTLDYLK